MENTQKLLNQIMQDSLRIAKLSNREVIGSMHIDPEREGVGHIHYHVGESGDFSCWMIQHGYFSLYLLVNQRLQLVATVPEFESDTVHNEIKRIVREIKN